MRRTELEDSPRPHLEGLLDERDLDLADREFPGLRAFYEAELSRPTPHPRTFLELLARFGAFGPRPVAS